jgi:hypothetical protein
VGSGSGGSRTVKEAPWDPSSPVAAKGSLGAGALAVSVEDDVPTKPAKVRSLLQFMIMCAPCLA